jgi:hypothetical protein
VLAAALPTHLAPTDIVCQDIDNVRFFAKFFLKSGKFIIDLLVLLCPGILISLFLSVIRRIKLGGLYLNWNCDHKDR